MAGGSVCGEQSRKHQCEPAAVTRAGARRLQEAAVQFGDFLGNRESESEPAVLACRRLIGLPESLEDVRQKISGMPIPLSVTTITQLRSSAVRSTSRRRPNR